MRGTAYFSRSLAAHTALISSQQPSRVLFFFRTPSFKGYKQKKKVGFCKAPLFVSFHEGSFEGSVLCAARLSTLLLSLKRKEAFLCTEGTHVVSLPLEKKRKSVSSKEKIREGHSYPFEEGIHVSLLRLGYRLPPFSFLF